MSSDTSTSQPTESSKNLVRVVLIGIGCLDLVIVIMSVVDSYDRILVVLPALARQPWPNTSTEFCPIVLLYTRMYVQATPIKF
jgi:hypothetical protein